MKYAILSKSNGQLMDYCESIEQADWFVNQPDKFELVDTTHSSKIEVIYTELGGPWGYGHQEPSFTTYGGLLPCIRRLYKWMQEEARVWGPDPRDIRDYFKNCRLYVNGEDKFDWWYNQYQKLDLKSLYV
jgi:hypothetical protein